VRPWPQGTSAALGLSAATAAFLAARQLRHGPHSRVGFLANRARRRCAVAGPVNLTRAGLQPRDNRAVRRANDWSGADFHIEFSIYSTSPARRPSTEGDAAPRASIAPKNNGLVGSQTSKIKPWGRKRIRHNGVVLILPGNVEELSWQPPKL